MRLKPVTFAVTAQRLRFFNALRESAPHKAIDEETG